MSISKMALKQQILSLQIRNMETIKAAKQVWEAMIHSMSKEEIRLAKRVLKEELQTLEILPRKEAA